MFQAGLSAQQQFERLNAALALPHWYDGQDWGIVNADAERVAEFVDFFQRNYGPHRSPWVIDDYVDLVLESASDAVRLDPHFSLSSIDDFVTSTARLAPERLQYWISEDWPIAEHLRGLRL